jgi:hypothetical protein
MDELEAVKVAEEQVKVAQEWGQKDVFVPVDVLRALLARATRSHD